MAIDKTVRVSDVISASGELRQLFGITLFLTTDTTLTSGAGRVSVFAGIDDVAGVFADTSVPYKAASVYFSQTPYPKNLVIGRWFNAAAPAVLKGGAAQTLTALKAITAGALTINGQAITALNFGSATSYADVAAALQTKLRAASASPDLATCTVVFDVLTAGFKITSTTTGAAASIGLATPPGTGVDAATPLGLTATAGAQAFDGADVETVTQALTACFNLNPSPYFVTLETALNDTSAVDEANAFCSTRDLMFRMECNLPAALTTNETTTRLATFATSKPGRTFACYTPAAAPFLALSSAAKLGSINFNGANSMLTLNLTTMPGVTPTLLTPTQQTELDRKRTSYYIDQGASNAYINNGGFAVGVWDDVRIWLDWFKNAVKIDVYNLLASGRVPQTADGMASIQRVIELVCEQGVNNGGIAPGQLSEATRADIAGATGNEDFDGFLSKGYFVYADAVSTLSQSDRNARMVPPFRIWLKGSGAVHFVDISITFEN